MWVKDWQYSVENSNQYETGESGKPCAICVDPSRPQQWGPDQSTRTTHTDITPSHPPRPWPNPVPHSPPTPPSPPRAKHMHMSHTPPTPLTTRISCTSPELNKTPEPRAPPIYALTATTLPPDPSHPNSLSAYTHATQTAVHASQSQQQPHPQHRVPRQPHRQTKYYHRSTNTTQAHRPSSKSERNLIIL